MRKPKLVYREQDYPCFTQGWIRPLVEPHFELVQYTGQTLDPDAVILTVFQQEFEADAWYRPLEQSHRVVIDHLYDSDTECGSRQLTDSKFELRSPHWMWYSSATLSAHYGYNDYQPQPHYTHDFFCLMNKVRDHRDRVMTELAPELATARWSYVDRGRDIGDAQERATPVFWEYYTNPEWYNTTTWSLVVESWMRGDAWFASPQFPNYRTEISEKSYKPLAYYHPAVICGSVDTLKFLRSQGFETWSNLWDESYDSIAGDVARCDAVLDLVREVSKTYNRHWGSWDLETQLKLEHNHARYFDLDLVRRRFRDEIIGDIERFLA